MRKLLLCIFLLSVATVSYASQTVTTEEEITKMTAGNKFVVLSFFAENHSVSKFVKGIVEKAEKRIGNKVKFLDIDYDAHRDIASLYGVDTAASYAFIKEGKIVEKAMGTEYNTRDKFLTKIRSTFGLSEVNSEIDKTAVFEKSQKTRTNKASLKKVRSKKRARKKSKNKH